MVAETSENLILCSEVRKRNIGLKWAEAQSFTHLFSLSIFFNTFAFKLSWKLNNWNSE